MALDSTHPHFIPERWKPLVKTHIANTQGEERDYLSADNFRSSRYVKVFFEDNSFALFHYAFCLQSEELQEVAVFTEHCGYYYFSSAMTSVQELEAI